MLGRAEMYFSLIFTRFGFGFLDMYLLEERIHWERLDLFVCWAADLSMFQSIGVSVCRRIGLSVGQSVCRSVGLSVSRSVGLQVCQSVGQSVCRSVGLSGSRAVGLSVFSASLFLSLPLTLCPSDSLINRRHGSTLARPTSHLDSQHLSNYCIISKTSLCI